MDNEMLKARQAEAALLASKQRYERMANTVPVMLYDSVLDAAGTSRFLYVAPGPCRDLLELDPEALLQDMSLVWRLVHPEDIERFHQADLVANRSGEEFSEEVRIITPSGRLKWLLVNSKPNPAVAGEPVVWSGFLQDITARKRAEEKLRETEQRLRLVIENSTNLFYIHTRDQILTYVSPQSREFFDCEPAEALVRWTELITDHPLNRAGIEAAQRAIDTGRRQPSYPLECIGKKGRKIWVEVNETPIVEQGRTVAVAGTLTDITGRKHAEKEREQYFSFFQTSADLMCIANPDGIFLKTNPAFTVTLGYTANELVSKPILEFVHPDDRQATRDEIFRQQETGFTENFENRYLCKDGSIKWLSWRVSYDKVGGIVFATARDITAKKEAEAALQESEFFFRESQRAAAVGSYKADLTAGYWQSSEVLDELFGIGPGYDRSIQGWLDIAHPDDREMLERYLKEEVIAQQKMFTREYRIIRKNDGEIRWVSGLGALRLENDGQTLILTGTIQDITEQKRKDQENEKLEAQLQQIQKIESVGRLAGGVAHDFNNMLSVILGHVEMAQQKELVSPSLQEHLIQIQKAASRSADIVRQLLAFARRQTVSPEVLDLKDTVNTTLKMISRLIGEEIELLWRPDDDLWPIRMDPAQIDQILANLCINARDAISGIGRISLAARNFSCDDLFSRRHTGMVSGDYVLLTVSDDGCGMSQEILKKIFEPFFTTKGVGQGTGLGLATVYGIVKQNGGFIDVYSEPERGTSFRIYLPRYLGKEEQIQAAEVTTAVERGKETVLLVEDELAILDVATQMLEMQGYRVLAAATPGAAIRLAEEHRGEIHLLMTDVVMPEMNGRELAEKLLSLYPGLKRLFMSGYTADAIAHHGVLDEGVQFIQKPFTFKTLAAKVREVLDS